MDTESKTQVGYLLIADISGYTSFVARTELEHAQAVLGELLELLLAHLTPAMTLAKLEGDAVFVFAPESRLGVAETVIDLVEETYVAFRDRVEGIRVRTTCECNACRAIPTLDLKFIVHRGEYFIQQVANARELIGSDVNLAHRLLKNHVSEATGLKGYALFSAQFSQRLHAPLEGLHELVETYEHLGDVHVGVMNLRARYQQINAERHVMVAPGEADIEIVHDFAQPAPVVWEWLNDPQKRSQWMYERQWSAGLRPSGRQGAGARNHCTHGKDTITETILDWKPFQYVTSRTDGHNVHFVETVSLEPVPGARRARVRDCIKMEVAMPRWLRKPVFGFLVKYVVKYKNDAIFAKLGQLMAASSESAEIPVPDAQH